ncbi:MAG: hypothetical protein AB7O74_08805 [Candidatus Nanopelagicales bacterium]
MSEDAPRAGAEAARLLAAAQEWLRDSAPHLAPVDDEGRTCSCPVCRGIVRLREGDPESVGRWVDTAVAAFERVVSDLAASRSEPPATGAERAGAPADHAGSEDPVTPPPSEAAESPRPRRVRRVPLDDGASGTAGSTAPEE